MNLTRGVLIFLALALLGGCATMPTGPTVAAMPGPGKPFEVFQADDYACRQWAEQQIGGTSPSQSANQNLATGAAVGTLAGAGLGALIGSASGHAGAGAAIGAGAGLLTGTAMASGPAASSGYQLQRRYDMAYQQCMYAKGNQIPGARPVRAYGPPPGYGPPPPAYGPPPPAYGPPPPPSATVEGDRTRSSSPAATSLHVRSRGASGTAANNLCRTASKAVWDSCRRIVIRVGCWR